MIFRKTISIILSVIMLVCLMLPAASAAEAVPRTIKPVGAEYHLAARSGWDYAGAEATIAQYADPDEFRNIIFDAISQGAVFADVERLNIPVEAYDAITTFIFYGMPEAFNVYEVGYTYTSQGIILVNFSFRDFADTKAEYEACFAAMKASADSILDGIENNPALSDEKKALLLHDRLCVVNEYAYYTAGEIEHTAYGALVNGRSVCQGYAMAYMYLLDRVGIKNHYVSSRALNHAWNIVYIDDVPYHVDVTWDDVAWGNYGVGMEGAVKHDNFLRSTKGIKETGHTATDFYSFPTDTRYDSCFWQNSETEFQLIGNRIYYTDSVNQKIICADDGSVLADVTDRWYTGWGSYWVGNFSRLSSEGGTIFYSLSDGVYKYTLSTGRTEKIYTSSVQGLSVFGFTYSDGYLICQLNNTPNNTDGLRTDKIKYTDVDHAVYKLSADTSSAKTVYYVGDAFSSKNIKIIAHFTDGTTKTVESGVSFSGFSSDKEGEKTVVATYGGFSVSFTVFVKTPSVKTDRREITLKENEEFSLAVTTDPAGQTVSWKSSSQCVSVSDGKIKALSAGTAVVTGEITYGGKTYSVTVNVSVVCAHKNTEIHPGVSPTADSPGYTEGVFCRSCGIYVSGHIEIPIPDAFFTDGEYIKSDGTNIRMIPGVLVRELLLQAPHGKLYHKDGTPADGAAFVYTGMILSLPDGTRQSIAVSGDVDSDGSVTAADARLSLRGSVGLEAFSEGSVYYIAANADATDVLSAADARIILRTSVGLDWVGDFI